MKTVLTSLIRLLQGLAVLSMVSLAGLPLPLLRDPSATDAALSAVGCGLTAWCLSRALRDVRRREAQATGTAQPQH